MNFYQSLIYIFVCVVLCSCKTQQPVQEEAKDILSYVNPFIGTGGHGHTYPGASSPFGMVQLSPDTRLIGWDGCGGYHFTDSEIYGFSHTHLSGTGVSDYGDILLMPINGQETYDASWYDNETYKSRFSHDRENASPGLYFVYLDGPNCYAHLTTTERGGIHHYHFRKPANPGFVLDLEHRDQFLSTDIQISEDRKTITGHRHSKAWATDQRLYFVMEFSHPIQDYQVHTSHLDQPSKAIMTFGDNDITVKVAISATSLEGARKNFDAELKGKSFSQVKGQTEAKWRSELSVIDASFHNDEEKTIFYTALYHTKLAPNLYQDVDGSYLGMDKKIYRDADHQYYTVFSLWDTYRTLHPLFTLIDHKRTNDFVHTMLHKYEQGGILPIWDLSACYTGCMIGYHGVSAISDAYMKGIRDFDAELALTAMQHSATQTHLGLESYMEYGYIPMELEAESVSKTLEYSYDDWCIAQMAQSMGNEGVANRFYKRALFHRNIFEPTAGFYRAKRYGMWEHDFSPFEVNSNFTEANAWQYSLGAPHDIAGMMKLHGGSDHFADHLDKLFSASSETTGRDQVDITGLIGQYAHGNEPSHHIAYLYNSVGQAHKTQKMSREILRGQYANAPDGLSGNEDCGQMSAWYVMSALGLYPVAPGDTRYTLSSPIVDAASITLPNGNTFKILVEGQAVQNHYIQSVTLNGTDLTQTWIEHEEIMAGGTLVFNLGSKPSNWGSETTNRFITAVDDSGFIPAPFVSSNQQSFTDSLSITLQSIDPDHKINYRVGDSAMQDYTGEAIIIYDSDTLHFQSTDGMNKSALVSTPFTKRDSTLTVDVISSYSSMYDGGGNQALVDGIHGATDFRTGAWQGFEGKHMEVILSLDEAQEVETISCTFLQDENSWIFMPTSLDIEYVDIDGNWKGLGSATPTTSPQDIGSKIEKLTVDCRGVSTDKIKIIAQSLIMCPEWHKGYAFDGKAWIFADEIEVEF